MSAPVTSFPSFHDLKKKVAFEGGFSDGGVLCISETLTPSGVDLAPRAGTAVSGFTSRASDVQLQDTNASALVMNFDPVNPVNVEVSVVFEDGSVAPLQTVTVPPNTPPGAGVMPLPLFGVILTYPNKLRLKTSAVTSFQPPTRRVLLKACMVEFDKPADLDAE
jgi:hypothetical protein